MIRSFTRWMRVVLPPTWAMGVAATFSVIALVLNWWVLSLILDGMDDSITVQEERAIHLHQFSLGCIAFIYGLWRVLGFHPFYRPRYREWLRSVAWDPSKPLPLGPPTLVIQDGIVLLALAALGGDWEWGLVYGAAMLAGWSALLVAANYGAGLDALALLGALTLLPLMLAEFYPWLGAMTLPAYLIAAAGVKPGLRMFPWERMPRWEALNASKVEREGRPTDLWPLVRTFHSGSVPIEFALSHALLWATFLGAAAATLTVAIEMDEIARGHRYLRDASGMTTAVRCICLLLGMFRVLTYASYCRPPISLAGRIATGRLIIPGYDQIFVAPLLVLLIGFGGPVILWHWGASDPLAIGITLFAMVAIAFGMGPNLGRWHLTGENRIVGRRPVWSKRRTGATGG